MHRMKLTSREAREKILKGEELRAIIIKGDLDLQRLVIEGKLDLGYSIIKGYLFLQGTTIKGNLILDKTIIKEGLNLVDTTIEGILKFVDVTVKYLNFKIKAGPAKISVNYKQAQLIHWLAPNIPLEIRM